VQQTFTILMVEDEAFVVICLQDALEDAGFSVSHVCTGEDAVDALDEQHADVSALVTDIRLGGDVDGWKVGRHARQLNPSLPTVYISADSAHLHTVEGVSKSIMLQKPFAPMQLVAAISTLLNDATPHRPF
jgi:DNA-binding response OmpR family regulator